MNNPRENLGVLRAKLRIAKACAADAQREASVIERDIAKIESDMRPDPKLPIVSDHAVLRYIERVEGVDVEAIRSEILGSAERAVLFMLDGKIQRPDYTLVVQNGRVVTVTVAP